MRALLLLALGLLLVACGTAAPTRPPTWPPLPTAPPTPTLTSLQATAEQVRREQQVRQAQGAQATRTTACANLFREYSRHGQGFDQALAATDPQRMLIELRLLNFGSGNQPTSIWGANLDDAWREWIAHCGGR